MIDFEITLEEPNNYGVIDGYTSYDLDSLMQYALQNFLITQKQFWEYLEIYGLKNKYNYIQSIK